MNPSGIFHLEWIALVWVVLFFSVGYYLDPGGNIPFFALACLPFLAFLRSHRGGLAILGSALGLVFWLSFGPEPTTSFWAMAGFTLFFLGGDLVIARDQDPTGLFRPLAALVIYLLIRGFPASNGSSYPDMAAPLWIAAVLAFLAWVLPKAHGPVFRQCSLLVMTYTLAECHGSLIPALVFVWVGMVVHFAPQGSVRARVWAFSPWMMLMFVLWGSLMHPALAWWLALFFLTASYLRSAGREWRFGDGLFLGYSLCAWTILCLWMGGPTNVLEFWNFNIDRLSSPVFTYSIVLAGMAFLAAVIPPVPINWIEKCKELAALHTKTCQGWVSREGVWLLGVVVLILALFRRTP